MLWLGFVVWTWSFLTAPMTAVLDSFMHLVNLPFHEAGHIIFSPLGRLQMPLLGGSTGAEVEGHDWEAILGSLGWLHLDHTLARAARGMGAILMIGGLLCAAAVLYGRWNISLCASASTLAGPKSNR